MKKKVVSMLLCVVTAAGLVAGCGKQAAKTETEENEAVTAESTETADSAADTQKAAEEPIHVVVAGTPGYEPYTYVGEDGEETGYDIEILRAMDEIAPEIECEFTYSEWDTLMPGLDAGKFDIICNQLGRNEEREAMYYFEENPIACAGGALIVGSQHSDWTGYESLEGATVEASTGSDFTTHLEEYLEEHPGFYTIQYTESGFAQVLEDVANKRADVTMEDPSVARRKAEINGLSDSIYVIDQLYDVVPVYFMFARTDKGKQLAEIVDKYLPQLYYDGTLSEIANKYLGSDANIRALPENGFYTQDTLEEFLSAQ